MQNSYWTGRGNPWEHDPGPPRNRRWARLFAQTPNYRALSKEVLGREKFRWHFGPMFYRGRLQDNEVKVMVVGQEGAQDESLSHRSFTGGTGARMQHLLNHLGITESYLFLNTFVYPIYGQYGSKLRWLAQDPESPIVKHRHDIFNYVLERNDVHLVIAVGTAAKESVLTWVRSRGGSCSKGIQDLSKCTSTVLGPNTKTIGVLHPGGAGKGGAISKIIADFKKAIRRIEDWSDEDSDWLPPDPDGTRQPADEYRYRSAPIPFRDFPYGFTWRLGRGGTSSNRKDRQRSIQVFSKGGKYNGKGAKLRYSSDATGSSEGYLDEPDDLPYEPPKNKYRDYDKGPNRKLARLLIGGESGLEWPHFEDLGVTSHPSLGYGPIFRGRLQRAKVLVLADQQSNDDLFTGRALTGEAGQHFQLFLKAMGITRSYAILRLLPVDTTDLPTNKVKGIVNLQQVRKVYGAIVEQIVSASPEMGLILAMGPCARTLLPHVKPTGLTSVRMKSWHQSGALADWKKKLKDLEELTFEKDLKSPTFVYSGERGQIPRFDLPYGSLRWRGTSGDRAVRATESDKPSPNYYKLYMPEWAFRLKPEPLSVAELQAVEETK